LIVLDGKVYQGLADGKVREAAATMTTPFAVVTQFDRDGTLPCPAVSSLNELDAKIDSALPGQSVFYAIRVDGKFASLTLRSVPRQEPPYRPLVEVAKQQSMWTHENVSGTMIGMRSPPWTDKLNVPGYHWHFVSDDRQMGGHVIDCKIESATITYDECDSWLIKLPGSQALQAGDLNQDLSRELKEVESKRER
jgi:acetolactate decarboxylase